MNKALFLGTLAAFLLVGISPFLAMSQEGSQNFNDDTDEIGLPKEAPAHPRQTPIDPSSILSELSSERYKEPNFVDMLGIGWASLTDKDFTTDNLYWVIPSNIKAKSSERSSETSALAASLQQRAFDCVITYEKTDEEQSSSKTDQDKCQTMQQPLQLPSGVSANIVAIDLDQPDAGGEWVRAYGIKLDGKTNGTVSEDQANLVADFIIQYDSAEAFVLNDSDFQSFSPEYQSVLKAAAIRVVKLNMD